MTAKVCCLNRTDSHRGWHYETERCVVPVTSCDNTSEGHKGWHYTRLVPDRPAPALKHGDH